MLQNKGPGPFDPERQDTAKSGVRLPTVNFEDLSKVSCSTGGYCYLIWILKLYIDPFTQLNGER